MSRRAKHFNVAILGGGLAGLTLALVLERAGTSFVLLEIHESIAPEVGAGIGLLPNGIRILDQLGLLDEVEKHTVPQRTWHHIGDDGHVIADVEAQKRYCQAFGYDSRFLKRSQLLKMLYSAIQKKDAVRTSVRLSSLEQSETDVKLVAVDGSCITADIVVGADGVHSTIRQYIDQLMDDRIDSNAVPTSEVTVPSQGLPASGLKTQVQFTCIFGTSSPVSGIDAGESFAVYRKDVTVLVFTAKDGIIFWFVFEHIDHANDDIEKACLSVGHLVLSSTVKFGDVFANRLGARKTVLEEGLAENWHAGRSVIIGDAAHRMVPHAAMGANQAIESAAAIANELLSINGWIMENITAALEGYAQKRRERAATAIKGAGIICRTQLCCSGHEEMIKTLPRLTLADWISRAAVSFRGAAAIESLPLTERGRYYEEKLRNVFGRLGCRGGEDKGIESRD